MRFTKCLPFIFAAGVFYGCGDNEEERPEEYEIIRPQSVEVLELSQTQYSVAGLGAVVGVVSSRNLGALLATSTGVYQIGTNENTLIMAGDIVGLAALSESFLIATPTSVHLWDGNLQPTAFTQVLLGQEIQAMAVFNANIWLATNQGVYVYQNGNLLQFPELLNIEHISSFNGASRVILSRQHASPFVLDEVNGEYFGQSLEDENIALAVVSMQNKLIALKENTLVQRFVKIDSGLAHWAPVALTASENDTGATNVTSMLADPTSGATWMASDIELIRWQQEFVFTMPLPTPQSELVAAPGDGAVWLADDSNLYKLQGSNNPITFAEDIESFYETNCSECHAPGGPAHTLNTYAIWVDEIDIILPVVDDGTMPAGDRELVGATSQLLHQWLADGLQP